MSTVTPEQISMEVSKERALFIQPWVAAHLSDLWYQMKSNIKQTIVKKSKQDHVRTSQVMPASARSLT